LACEGPAGAIVPALGAGTVVRSRFSGVLGGGMELLRRGPLLPERVCRGW
jgi:hypothetical protein